jgi:hypothetical protein
MGAIGIGGAPVDWLNDGSCSVIVESSYQVVLVINMRESSPRKAAFVEGCDQRLDDHRARSSRQ